MDIWTITLFLILLIVLTTMQITLIKISNTLDEINSKINFTNKGDIDNG